MRRKKDESPPTHTESDSKLDKSKSQINLIGEIILAITATLAAIKGFLSELRGTPWWLLAVMAVLPAIWLLWPKKSKQRESKKISSAINHNSLEDSPITLLGLNGPKSYREYCEDIIHHIRWRWQWRPWYLNKDEPRPDLVYCLEHLCPSCQRDLKTRSESGDIVYYCDKCYFCWPLKGDLEQIEEDVTREIAMRARHPIEWQQAIERIRLAVPQQKVDDDPRPDEPIALP